MSFERTFAEFIVNDNVTLAMIQEAINGDQLLKQSAEIGLAFKNNHAVLKASIN